MKLVGSFSPPGDKSISHRLALFSILARGRTRLTHMATGRDVASSLQAAAKLGARVDYRESSIEVEGAGGKVIPKAVIDCGNSGTTMRLIMGILAGRDGEFVLDGDESLRRRPMERVAAPLKLMGADVATTAGFAPITIKGRTLTAIDYTLAAASAQLKSAVLLAGLQADGETLVHEPIPSRDHTEKLISLFGGHISNSDNVWRVEPSPLTLPPDLFVPGDPSSAAFFLCTAVVSPASRVTAQGILLNPTRTGFINVLKRMGAEIHIEEKGREPEPWGDVTVSYSPHLRGVDITGMEIPGLVDEVPILALTATQAVGVTIFKDVGELRIKETDRLEAVTDQLGAMGADIHINGDNLVVSGPTRLTAPGRLDARGDHRMAMTLRLAGLMAGAEPRIDTEGSIAISYPGFQDDLKRLHQ